MKVGLINSAARIDWKLKGFGKVRARALYHKSALFRYQARFSQKHYDKTYVLSAMHIVVGLDDLVDPFDCSLNSMNSKELKNWQQAVVDKLSIFPCDTEFYILAGRKYRTIIPLLQNKYFCHFPLQGMGIGNQLHYFKQELS